MDKTYKKQLEKFGIESTRVIDGGVEPKHSVQLTDITKSIVKAIMETMEGRQWLHSKLEMCRVFTSPFIPADPYGTSFFSGIQAVGHNLQNDIMISAPENYFLMVQEANARNVK